MSRRRVRKTKKNTNNMLGKIALVLFYLLSPAVVLWACNKWKVLGKIGPVLILYFLGIIVANLNLIPADCKGIQDTISTVAIPLALPMMLYSCDFKRFSIKTSLKITIIGIIAVMIAVVTGFFLLRDGMGEEAPVVAGAIAGKCTGGTPNLAALKVMLEMENSTFLILNSFDGHLFRLSRYAYDRRYQMGTQGARQGYLSGGYRVRCERI